MSGQPAGPSAKPAPAQPGGGRGPTFGQVLIQLGLLTPEQLTKALETQQERSRRGDFARLGHILVELGFLTNEQVQEVLRAQEITILQCEACTSQFNVRGFNADLRYECPKCHGDLRRSGELKNVAVQDQLQARSPVEGLDDTVRLTRAEDSNTARIRQLRLLGKYEILGELARGGMGIIYKARQLDLERIVALKTLRQEELDKPDAASRFLHEAQAVAKLRHPNIVAVYEVGTHDGIEYFTMEFIEGLPLDRHMLRAEIKARKAIEIVAPVAEALDYAHRQGVVHRDLKPANIILDKEGVPFLVDWGIAKHMDQGLAPDEEEDLLGSIPYMAPEYVEGAEYDELCDVYSLGVLLYEVIGGPNCLPFYDPDTRRFLEKIMCEKHEPIRNKVPDIDEGVERIVEKMIAPRAQRYRSAREVVVDMRRWLLQQDPLQGMPDELRQSPDAPLSAPPVRSQQPNLIPMLVPLLALSVLGMGWAGVTLSSTREQMRAIEHKLEAERLTHARELIGARLVEAEALHANAEDERALQLLNSLVDRYQELGIPELAPAYRLRAQLRRDKGDPNAEEDALKANRLAGSAE